MLIRFNVTNFLSFDEETEFNMLAAKSLKNHGKHKYPLKNELNLLKASAIYGANGAGKSNLVRAIDSLKQFVERGRVPLNTESKKFRLNPDDKNKPISFEIEFSFKDKIYTYGLSFDSGLVLNEWLYESGISTPKLIFERTYSEKKKHSEIKVADRYIKNPKQKMLISLMEENLLKTNELLLSKADELKFPEITCTLLWIREGLTIMYPDTTVEGFVTNICENSGFKVFTENLLKTFNVGIDRLDIQKETLESFLSQGNEIEGDLAQIKKTLDAGGVGEMRDPKKSPVCVVKENNEYLVKKVQFYHRAKEHIASFDIKEQSDGTQRLMDFIPVMNELLSVEKTFIIDEIDRSLHPAMLHALIKKIMNDGTTKGQLIFTTHESSLLDSKIFRADEIWFVEKNKEKQTSELYTLNEFKPRTDLDIEKGYLNGRFGAIPFLSKLEDLNWNDL